MGHIIHDDRPHAGYEHVQPEAGFDWAEDDPAKGTPYETGPRKNKNDSCPEHAAKALATFVAWLSRVMR